MHTQGLMESKTLNKQLLNLISFLNGNEVEIPEEDLAKIYEDVYKAYKLRKILIASTEFTEPNQEVYERNGIIKIITDFIYSKRFKTEAGVVVEIINSLEKLNLIKKTTYNEEDEIEKIEYSLELEL